MSSFVSRSLKFRKAIICLSVMMVISFSAITFISSAANAAGQTCVWTGSNSALWSDPGNWNNCDNSGAPTTGDILVFNNNGTKASSNDIDGLSVDAVYVAGSDYVIDGNNLTIAASTPTAMDFAGSNNDFQINTTIVSNITTAINASAINTISGGIDLSISGVASDFRINASAALDLDGTISGTVDHDFVLGNNTGTVSYNSTSVFSVGGVMRLADEGSIECSSASCFGNDGNALIIDGGGDVTFTVATSLLNAITINSGIGNTVIKNDALGIVVLQGAVTANVSMEFSRAFWLTSTVSIAEDATVSFTDLTGGKTTIFGVVSGDGNINVSASLELDGNNTYTGTTTVGNPGGNFGLAQLYAVSDNALGSTTGETIVNEYGKIVFDSFNGDLHSSEPVRFTGGNTEMDFYSTNDIEISGTITLSGNNYIYVNAGYLGDITIDGKITGTGNLTYNSFGSDSTDLTIGGTVSNDYEGTTTVDGITVAGAKTAGAIAVPGDLLITSTAPYSRFYSREDDQIANNAQVTITGSNSVYAVSFGHLETVGTVVGDGMLALGGSTSLLNVGYGNLSGTFSGTISSGGSTFQKVGTGTWELTGTAVSSTGGDPNFIILDGILAANFSDNSAEISTFAVQGGTLKGDSHIGPLYMVSGIIAPGNSPGCLNAGPVTMLTDVELQIEIGGATQCIQYDNLTSSGSVAIAGATLSVSQLNNYAPPLGQVFTIVNGTSITGQFAGLSNDSTIDVGGIFYRVNYNATTVTLTVVSAMAVTTPTTLPGATPTTVIAPEGTSARGALPATGWNSSLVIVAFACTFLSIGIVLITKRQLLV